MGVRNESNMLIGSTDMIKFSCGEIDVQVHVCWRPTGEYINKKMVTAVGLSESTAHRRNSSLISFPSDDIKNEQQAWVDLRWVELSLTPEFCDYANEFEDSGRGVGVWPLVNIQLWRGDLIEQRIRVEWRTPIRFKIDARVIGCGCGVLSDSRYDIERIGLFNSLRISYNRSSNSSSENVIYDTANCNLLLRCNCVPVWNGATGYLYKSTNSDNNIQHYFKEIRNGKKSVEQGWELPILAIGIGFNTDNFNDSLVKSILYQAGGLANIDTKNLWVCFEVVANKNGVVVAAGKNGSHFALRRVAVCSVCDVRWWYTPSCAFLARDSIK